MLNSEDCPFCNQKIHGLVPERNVPRIRIKQILGLKEEIHSLLETKTSWGKNELKEALETVFDRNLQDA